MGDRDIVGKHFGPKVFEAFMLIIRDEINTLRQLHGLAPRTNGQIITAVKDKLAEIGDYDWM